MDKKEFELEKSEAAAISGIGSEFSVRTSGIYERLRYGITRKFELHEPTTGALDLMAGDLLKISIDEEALAGSPILEANRLVKAYAAPISRIVAISVLNERCVRVVGYRNGLPVFSRPDIRKISRWSDYFLWKLRPTDLVGIALSIRQIMNVGPFIKSTRLMSSGFPRTTKPKADPVEGDT